MKTNALFENELEVFKRRGGCARGKQGKVKGNDGRGYWEQRNVKNKMKIEKMKKEKEIREMKELQQVPKISKRSKDIVRKLNNEYNNKCKTNREESYVKEVKEKCQRKRNLIEMLCLSRRMRKEEEDEEMKLKMNLQHTTPSHAITKVNYTNSNNESNDNNNNNELLQLRKRINEYYYKHKRIGNHGVIYHPIQPYNCSTNNNNNVNNGNNINIQNSHQYLHTH